MIPNRIVFTQKGLELIQMAKEELKQAKETPKFEFIEPSDMAYRTRKDQTFKQSLQIVKQNKKERLELRLQNLVHSPPKTSPKRDLSVLLFSFLISYKIWRPIGFSFKL